MSNCGGKGGGAGSQPMSTAVQYTEAQINFEDLTPYLNYGIKYRGEALRYAELNGIKAFE